MSVSIRMKRMGRKNRPYYRVVVIPKHKHREAPPIEEVGTYDPLVADKAKRATLNLDRIDYWLSVGAQPSDTVKVLIKKVRTNRFTTAKPPAPLTAPKALSVSAAAESSDGSAPAEEAAN